MQSEIMAQGAVNDIVDHAVNQSAARTIQSAVRNKNAIKEVASRYTNKLVRKIQTATRGHLARNELGNRINAAEQQQARITLTPAIRSRKAQHELATNQQQFNPIDYQDALRANKNFSKSSVGL